MKYGFSLSKMVRILFAESTQKTSLRSHCIALIDVVANSFLLTQNFYGFRCQLPPRQPPATTLNASKTLHKTCVIKFMAPSSGIKAAELHPL